MSNRNKLRDYNCNFKCLNLFHARLPDLQIFDYGQEGVQIYHKQIGLYIHIERNREREREGGREREIEN